MGHPQIGCLRLNDLMPNNFQTRAPLGPSLLTSGHVRFFRCVAHRMSTTASEKARSLWQSAASLWGAMPWPVQRWIPMRWLDCRAARTSTCGTWWIDWETENLVGNFFLRLMEDQIQTQMVGLADVMLDIYLPFFAAFLSSIFGSLVEGGVDGLMVMMWWWWNMMKLW